MDKYEGFTLDGLLSHFPEDTHETMRLLLQAIGKTDSLLGVVVQLINRDGSIGCAALPNPNMEPDEQLRYMSLLGILALGARHGSRMALDMHDTMQRLNADEDENDDSEDQEAGPEGTPN